MPAIVPSVLVVEDDPVILKGLTLLLRAKGHTVAAAATVAEAGSWLIAAPPTHVLLDLNLPDGTGNDVLRGIRARPHPPRVALLTGSSETPLLDEARALGIDALFIKPPNWGEVLDWIH